MNMVDLIEKKRDGESLKAEEIYWIINKYCQDKIPEYQISAFLMAVYFQGMSRDETVDFTQAMIDSGDTIDLSSIPGIKADKHSTGGVGDKVSLILAPLVAECGVPVPMMSGRGLGHTGGTLDKLEAIPGFNTAISADVFKEQLRKIGCAMIGQTRFIAPADRLLYALRDVTGCVPSIPLICSSIISKKKAEGADALVLDVKVGKGAFLKTREETLHLAEELVYLGNKTGIKTAALLTRMDEPLGQTAGNWLETREAIDCLKGKGPADVMEVTLALSALMLLAGRQAVSHEDARRKLDQALYEGRAFERFRQMVICQGGDVNVIDHPDDYPLSQHEITVKSRENGFIKAINAKEIGLTAVMLGAGRLKTSDRVDAGAGLILHKKIGSPVQKGEKLITFYTQKESAIEAAEQKILSAFAFSETPAAKTKWIDKLIDPFYIVN